MFKDYVMIGVRLLSEGMTHRKVMHFKCFSVPGKLSLLTKIFTKFIESAYIDLDGKEK